MKPADRADGWEISNFSGLWTETETINPPEGLEAEFRSQEYQEVLGSPPPILARSGLLIFGICLSVLFAAGIVIPYPGTVSGPVTLEASPFPATVTWPASGKLADLAAVDGAIVMKNAVLARVGDANSDGRQIGSLLDWVNRMPLQIGQFARLEQPPAVDPSLLGAAAGPYLSVKQAMADDDAWEPANAAAGKSDDLEGRRAAADRLAGGLQELRVALYRWNDAHVVRAPQSGRIYLAGFFANNQLIAAGRNLAIIEPLGARLVAFASVPVADLSKIQIGQPVTIGLDAYPAAEYGRLHGNVAAISGFVANGTFDVEIALPNKAGMSDGRYAGLRPNMAGSATIRIKPMSFIGHLLFSSFMMLNRG